MVRRENTAHSSLKFSRRFALASDDKCTIKPAFRRVIACIKCKIDYVVCDPWFLTRILQDKAYKLVMMANDAFYWKTPYQPNITKQIFATVYLFTELQNDFTTGVCVIFTGKSAALLMRKIRPEAMTEAVDFAVDETCRWIADWHLHEEAVPFTQLGQFRAHFLPR